MTSSPRPANAGPSTAPSTQPLTPPADAPAAQNGTSQANQAASANQAQTSTPTPAISQPTQVPATSLQDTGKSRRPRDARLIHMLLASLGVTAYQERVPLQLLDFAYRYTAGTLQDAVYLATEGYPGERETGGRTHHAHQDLNSVSLGALRMSIASRLHYQFQPGLPKEFLMDMAAERNRMMLPGVSRGVDGGTAFNTAAPGVIMGGMRLPPERFCQTGVSWSLKEEWESEGEEEMEVDNNQLQQQRSRTLEKENGDEADEDEGDGRMEDVFGDDGLKEDGQDEDKTMVDA